VPTQLRDLGVDPLERFALGGLPLILQPRDLRLDRTSFLHALRLADDWIVRRPNQEATAHPVPVPASVMQAHLLLVIALLGLEICDTEKLAVEIPKPAELRHLRTDAHVAMGRGKV